MTEITNEQSFNEFCGKRNAVLFFHAPWSQYAVISKQMVELIESYAKEGRRDLPFFFGKFEDELCPLAEALVQAGVPADVAFAGNGSLSFFHHGQHVHTMRSVIGVGTWAVWQLIDELLENM